MRGSKLVDIIITFNEAEFRLFHRFVNSKLFNQNKKIILLFEFIRDKFRYKTSDMSKMSAYAKIFPNESYDDQTMRHLMSNLLKILKQFLAFQEMNEQPSTRLIALSKSMRKRNLWKQFDASVKQSLKSLDNRETKDMNFLYQNYQLEQERYNALIERKRATETNLQEVINSLDISFFANRLRQTCHMLAHRNVYKAEYDLGIINDIVREVRQKALFEVPAIGIYYYVYLTMTESDNQLHMKQLQHELTTNGHLFGTEEMCDIYLLVINSRIRMINKDRHDLMSETLELYKTGIERGYLLTNGQISRFTYKNVITVAIGLKLFDWARQFIETYQSILDPVYQAETYQFNLAKLNYAMQRYDDALRSLMTTSLSDDIYINLDTKILMAKVYFELNDIDALESLIASFQVFIRRKKGLSYQRINYQNFINCLKKLNSLNPYDKAAREMLTVHITGLLALPEKDWFLRQLGRG